MAIRSDRPMVNRVSEFDETSPDPPISSVCSLGLCRKRKGPLRTSAGGHSDIGTVRESIDDLVFASNQCRLYVVLDGVGGNHGGREASLIVLERLRANIEGMCEATFRDANQDLTIAVSHALKEATKSMLGVANTIPDLAKMGTVFALAYVIDGVLLFTRVGDCRVYLIRRGTPRQLTKDETFVQTMLDAGVIRSDEVRQHPMRNVILNAVSTRSEKHDPIVHSIPLLPDDIVLLTSDGVTDYLTDEQLVAAATDSGDPEETSQSIVANALEAGSRDNVSCVVVQIAKAPEADQCERSQLHYELSRLHEHLCDIGELEDELKYEMAKVANDIRRALKQGRPATINPLRERLKEGLSRFEANHPRLSSIVSNIANALSRLGI